MANNMSDMIATMALNGATKEELNRVIEYSAAVIQLEKMRDAKGIDALEKKYCDCEAYKSRCKDCVYLVEDANGSWVCDDFGKFAWKVPDAHCPVMSDPSPIKHEPKTFEEETDIMDCFFDKYESLIQAAPRNSLLWMIRDLDDAVMGIAAHQVDVDHLMTEDDENLKTAEACITHVAVLLAQMWADENEDIELSCVDPATGEEAVVKSEHKCVLAPDGVCPDGCHNGDGYLCEFDDCPYEKREEE